IREACFQQVSSNLISCTGKCVVERLSKHLRRTRLWQHRETTTNRLVQAAGVTAHQKYRKRRVTFAEGCGKGDAIESARHFDVAQNDIERLPCHAGECRFAIPYAPHATTHRLQQFRSAFSEGFVVLDK